MLLLGTDAGKKRIQTGTVSPVGKVRSKTAHREIEPTTQGITTAKGRTGTPQKQGQNKKLF
jgi:hypothetical protein